MSAIEDRYFNDFCVKDYEAAIHSLWEDHCAGYSNCPTWPPTLEQVKKEIKSIQDGRAYANERR
jgi:hypothetical protein